MDTGLLITIAAIVIAVLVVITFRLGWHARKRQTKLSVNLRDLAIRTVPGHATWYVDLRADFHNVGNATISVGALRAVAAGPGESELESKRILGDKARQKYDHAHPPDITLRLPILVDPGRRVTYRFHIFFTAHLHRLWNKGQVHLHATTADGVTTTAECTLAAPVVFPTNRGV